MDEVVKTTQSPPPSSFLEYYIYMCSVEALLTAISVPSLFSACRLHSPICSELLSPGFFRICRMQRGREGREKLFNFGDPFRGFHRFGSFPSLFSVEDPFDDPFFSRPIGSGFFGPATRENPHGRSSEGPTIEELNSDDEGEVERDKDSAFGGDGKCKGAKKHEGGSSKEPSVQHPDDDDDDDAADDQKSIALKNGSDHGREQGMQHQSFGVQSCKVTYGGVNGAYYTSSRTRRAGTDGVVFEESKEADKTTGQATHRVCRGINDKGHTVTRKLNSDGKVDTMQMLHNLEQDELKSFEEAWRGNSKGHLPKLVSVFRNSNDVSGGGARPFREIGRSASPSRSKKVVRINID